MRHSGDLLTAARLLATPVFAWLFWRAFDAPAARLPLGLLFAGVCASDYFDGVLARRAGRASPRGRTFDSFTDIAFLLAALSTAVAVDGVPWWVPAAVAVSFSFYVVDSWFLRPSPAAPGLVASRVGHWGGIGNYVLVGVLTFNDACALHVLPRHLLWTLFILVPLYSAAAIVTRLDGR